MTYLPSQVNTPTGLQIPNPADKGIFGSQLYEGMVDALSIDYSTGIPTQVTPTLTGTGATALVGGHVAISTGTTPNSSAILQTNGRLAYKPGHDVRFEFTAAFTAPAAGVNQFAGLYDANNGFFIGFQGATFNAFVRTSGVTTPTPRTQFIGDPLDGSANSLFTRAGTPEAIDFTKSNVYRVQFGWLGSAPVRFEVLSPDGNWVRFHDIKYPNLQVAPSIASPLLPMRMEVSNGATTTNATMQTGSWRVGSYDTPQFGGQWGHLTAAATTTLKTGAGVLESVILNSSPVHTAVVLNLYDGLDATGPQIASITIIAGVNPSALPYNLRFNTGLTAVLVSAGADVTVVYY